MTAVLEAWTEWKRRCAADLCSASAQSALRDFALSRFRICFRRHAGRGPAAEDSAVSPKDAWHLFETHLVTGNTRQGKRYKDWLFARVPDGADEGATLDTVQGGATLIMRDVVRKHILREHTPRMVLSLQQPVGGAGSDLTLEDLLPGTLDTADDVARREYARLADRHADTFFEEMTHRERIALLARQVGLSLAHPVVVKAAQCGKSMVNAALKSFVTRATSSLQTSYANEDTECLHLLCLMTLDSVTERILSWGFSEKGPGRSFLVVKGTEETACGASTSEGWGYG